MKQARRTLAGLALAAVLLTGSVFAAAPAAPEGSCVLDEANVLSERTEQAVNDLTIALSEACGAEIAVLTVDFTGASSTADYAADTLNSWGVGDRDKNNGVLLLLVIGADASTVKTHLLSAGALALALFCLTSILFVATWIEQKFGRHVIVILSKVTGLILAAMASQMIFTGVRSFLVP